MASLDEDDLLCLGCVGRDLWRALWKWVTRFLMPLSLVILFVWALGVGTERLTIVDKVMLDSSGSGPASGPSQLEGPAYRTTTTATPVPWPREAAAAAAAAEWAAAEAAEAAAEEAAEEPNTPMTRTVSSPGWPGRRMRKPAEAEAAAEEEPKANTSTSTNPEHSPKLTGRWKAMDVRSASDLPPVGPGRYCPPRHRHAFITLAHQLNLKCHPITWRQQYLPRPLPFHATSDIDTRFKPSFLELNGIL